MTDTKQTQHRHDERRVRKQKERHVDNGQQNRKAQHKDTYAKEKAKAKNRSNERQRQKAGEIYHIEGAIAKFQTAALEAHLLSKKEVGSEENTIETALELQVDQLLP